MPKRRRFPVALSLLVALVTAAVPAAALAGGRSGAGLQRIDRVEDCEENVPVAISASPTPGGTTIALNLLVLHDGVLKTDAEAIVAKAAPAYSPLNLSLVATYRKVAFVGDKGVNPPQARADALVAEAKTLLGGTRPVGTDIVFVLTNKDVYLSGGDATGYADCIGGIRYPNRSFALGEAIVPTESVGPFTFYLNGTAKVLAHEIGHLLGARHEHSNCAQGVGAEDLFNSEPSACTLMIAYMDLQSLHFGTPEAMIVRAHAENYAAP